MDTIDVISAIKIAETGAAQVVHSRFSGEIFNSFL
jgi:hypothetical protein